MHATLHKPGAVPRTLTAAELGVLDLQFSGVLTLDFAAAAPALAGLLGTSIPVETLALGLNYLIVAPENAADYDFGPTPSAQADFTRLTGIRPDEDEPLSGPFLIVEV